MLTKSKRLLILTLLPFLVLSCVTPLENTDDPNNPDPGNPNGAAELIPLSVGTQWSYHLSTPAVEEDHLYRITGLTPYTIGTSIYAVHLMNGPVTGYGSTLSLFLEYSTRGFFNNDDGVNILKELSPDDITSSLWFKYPCSAGDTYDGYSVGSVNYSVTNNYLETSFNCIQYIYNDGNFQHEYFIYPGLGIIRAELYDQSITFELTGYTIN